MTRARRESVHPSQPGFYHCISRCVRRAYLCGNDINSGRNFNHRRQWIETRIEHLSNLFCVDIYAYAIMSNHYHLVVRIDPQRARKLTDRQVSERWSQVYSLRANKRQPSNKTINTPEKIAIWRARLGNLSWFMKALNEPIARTANTEDECTGHFWESRFKSLPLLDEKAVIACMAYVDLNPIRNGEVSHVDKSVFTSIKRRISKRDKRAATCAIEPVFTNAKQALALSISKQNYLQLLSWTARQHRRRPSKRQRRPAVLRRFGTKTTPWLTVVVEFERLFRTAAGNTDSVISFYRDQTRQRILDNQGRKLLYG